MTTYSFYLNEHLAGKVEADSLESAIRAFDPSVSSYNGLCQKVDAQEQSLFIGWDKMSARIDALERLVNDSIASREPKHCPFCQEKLQELSFRLAEIQNHVLRLNAIELERNQR